MFHRFHCHPTRRDHHCPRDPDEVASRRRQPPCLKPGSTQPKALPCPQIAPHATACFVEHPFHVLARRRYYPPEELTAPRPHTPGSPTGRNHDITRLTRQEDPGRSPSIRP